MEGLTPSPIQELVERLRAPGGKFASICHEAADALEDCMRRHVPGRAYLEAQMTIAALRAELEIKENERHAASVSFANAQAEIERLSIHQMKASALDLDKAEETIAALRAELERMEPLSTLHVHDSETIINLRETITALRAENEKLKELRATENVLAEGHIGRAQAEIARLRAALEAIAKGKWDAARYARAVLPGRADKG